jgi:hypothetical protein
VLEKQITDTQANKNTVEADPFMEILVQANDGIIFSGTPLNIEEWEYLMHEFIQGIYEAAGKEAPLQIQFRKNFPDHSFFIFIMTLYFKSRTVQIQTDSSQSGSKQITENWEQTKSVLKDVYNLQYLAEQGYNETPKEPGSFINSGDGIWYELTTGVKNPGKRRDTLSKLEKYFLSFNVKSS